MQAPEKTEGTARDVNRDVTCPNCKATISTASAKCLHCGADFGPGSAWHLPSSEQAESESVQGVSYRPVCPKCASSDIKVRSRALPVVAISSAVAWNWIAAQVPRAPGPITNVRLAVDLFGDLLIFIAIGAAGLLFAAKHKCQNCKHSFK